MWIMINYVMSYYVHPVERILIENNQVTPLKVWLALTVSGFLDMLKTGTLGKSRQVFCSRHGYKVDHADLSFLNIMEALQYRSTVWICGKLCKETNIPNTACLPEPLFVYIMKQKCTWGRYVVYMTWLHIQFPTQGKKVWSYLNKMYPQWRHSFLFLLGQWLWYHVQKSIGL